MPVKNLRAFVFAAIVLLKLILTGFEFNYRPTLNPDEHRNYEIARNYVNGNGYTFNGKLTAFYGSATVFAYKFLINYGISELQITRVLYVVFNALFFASLFWFFNLASLFLTSRQALWAAVVYGLYPSVFWFVGSLCWFENIGTYLLIYFVWRTIRYFHQGVLSSFDVVILSICTVISVLLRAQLLPIYFLLYAYLFVHSFLLKRNVTSLKQTALLVGLTLTLLAASHFPFLVKNKKMFGEHVLSNQMGFELLQGHNPTARGSWMGQWDKPGNPLYEYTKVNIPNLERLNEYEESVSRKHLAIKWIANHPLDELKLTARKLALFFRPHNYEVLEGSRQFNLINFLMHLFFFVFIGLVVARRIRLNCDFVLVLLPIIGSLLLSIVFFVGYRWRLYAEPFMILLACVAIRHLYDTFLVRGAYTKGVFTERRLKTV